MKALLLTALLSLSFLSITTQASPESSPLTVVELFTSQGCYSCPPADTLLGELKQDPNTIALACHVGYWNYLGWRDTFSKSFCDKRQRQYQQFLQGRTGVYTPQMIINGRYGVVGSRERHVRRVINHVQKTTPALAINIQVQNNALNIDLPSLAQAQQHRLLLLGISGHQRLPIRRGENGGKTLDYYNPVIEVIDLGSWKGKAKKLNQTVQAKASIKEWVVLAQSTLDNTITAAGKVVSSVK